MSIMSSPPLGRDTPDIIVDKVLRRVEVAKIARNLHDRLALASYKAQHDLENMSFTLVEAHVASSIKRTRLASSNASSSDTSSTTSERLLFSSNLESSPITAPFFSDDTHGAEAPKRHLKRSRFDPISIKHIPGTDARKRLRTQSMAPPSERAHSSWKSTHKLPESSPIYHRQTSHFSTSHGPNLSFVSETTTIPDSPSFGRNTQNDGQNRPGQSFSENTFKFHFSLPRTPPPSRSRVTSKRNNNAAGEEGADLLMYLAASPSPANPGPKCQTTAPSTPPSHAQGLSSSIMSTPGGGGFMAGFSTPGQQFNFADFVNITPSPAQGAFGSRTPVPAKTPLAAKEARRRLNFESLAPPGGSPNLSSIGHGSIVKENGLGMELGGELVS